MHGKEPDRWSVRRGLVFIAAIAALLWALIYLGLRALLN